MQNKLKIRPTSEEDAPLIKDLMDKHWGGEPLIIRRKEYFPSKLNGILAIQGEDVIGFLIYELQGDVCEIVVFEIFEKFKGIGTMLLNKLKEIVKEKNCRKLSVMTTNDNLEALRFYQKRGFHITGIHLNSVAASREMKPSIGQTGDHGIPLRDEIDMESFI